MRRGMQHAFRPIHKFTNHKSESSTSERTTKLGNASVISLQSQITYINDSDSGKHAVWRKRAVAAIDDEFESSRLVWEAYFRYGSVIFLIRDGFWDTNSFHSSMSIFPSPFLSASSNVCIIRYNWYEMKRVVLKNYGVEKTETTRRVVLTLFTIISMYSSERTTSDSCNSANTISLNYQVKQKVAKKAYQTYILFHLLLPEINRYFRTAWIRWSIWST